MSIERKKEDLDKMLRVLELLRTKPSSLSKIQEALRIFFELGVERMKEEIAEEMGG